MLRAFILQNLVIESGTARWRLNLAALEAGMPDLLDWPDSVNERQYDGPVLAVYGGASDYMSEAHAERVRRLFPAAELHQIAGAGHWLHAEKPEEFLAAVRQFLETA